MNILIVSENFLYGGLETRLRDFSEYCELCGNSVYFAVNNFDQEYNRNLDISKVYYNLGMKSSGSALEICNSVNSICEIISKNDIDIIEVHPFSSIIPAILAANTMKKPIIITIHGVMNVLEAYDDPYYHAIVYHLCLKNAELVVATSTELQRLLHLYSKNIITVPNGVNIRKFTLASVNTKGPWAIVSRFDIQKMPGIIDAISKLVEIGITEIHLFGEFTQDAEHFRRQIVNVFENAGIEVKQFGRVNNLHEILRSGYAGVCGMGRALLEAISMDLPALFVGYGGTIGLMDYNLFQIAKDANFSGRGLKVCSAKELQTAFEELKETPDKFRICNRVRCEIDSKEIWDRYIAHLQVILTTPVIEKEKIDLFHALLTCSQQQDQSIWKSSRFIGGILDILPEISDHFVCENFRLTKETYEKAKEIYEIAQKSYDKAKVSYEIAKDTCEKAKDAYRMTEESFEKTCVEVNDSLKRLEAIESSRSYKLARVFSLVYQSVKKLVPRKKHTS